MTLDSALVDRLKARLTVSSDAQTREVLAPFTGSRLFDLPLADEADVEGAVTDLRRGQKAWAARPLAERTAVMLRFHDLVLAQRELGLDVVQWETGKARRDAMEELVDVALTARHYARDAKRLLKPRRHRGVLPVATGVLQLQHPKGVVGVLSPWNYPLTLAASDALPALVAGNAVLLKPDVQTTLTAAWVIDLMIAAGLPEDVIRIVPGEGPEVGPMVIDRVDYVMFTGSTRVGREVAARCGERLIGCSLELGGKNAMIVRADADIVRAAQIAARACFANSGQLCISMERIYVHEDVYTPFLAAFTERVQAMTMSAGLGWGGDMGSLIAQRQVDRVQAHVEDAVSRGAHLVTGGKPRPDVGPYFFEPTVLTGVTDEMILCDEETFGPVVAVYPVSSDEEAVERANDSPYGLNAVVVSKDAKMGRTIAQQLHSGTVNVNEAFGPAWGSTRAPMGGMGDSGLGRRHGDEGLLKYTESQTIATQRFLGFDPQFGWSDEKWLNTLAGALSVMKKAGFK
jgi:succinate-semialdehyde dehydrogenase/glutarate-semialdehyde dehydrogenase